MEQIRYKWMNETTHSIINNGFKTFFKRQLQLIRFGSYEDYTLHINGVWESSHRPAIETEVKVRNYSENHFIINIFLLKEDFESIDRYIKTQFKMYSTYYLPGKDYYVKSYLEERVSSVKK